MALPANFSPVEHLHDLIRKEHNKRVEAWFKNQKKDSLETPKENAYQACLIRDEDDANTMLLRKLFFEFDVGHAQSLQTPIYGNPVQEIQRNVKFKPQIKLYFKERLGADVTNRTSPATGEITFRLMNESSSTISRAKAEVLATNIKREFANPIFIWEKGWYKYTYFDLEHGYDLRLLVKSKSEGIRITRQVLQVQSHTFNDNLGNYVDHDRSYSLNPGTHQVYGRTIAKPVERPRVDVRFKYAQLLINGRVLVVNLVATSDSGLKSVIQRIASA